VVVPSPRRPRPTLGLSRTCPCWASCQGESWQVTAALSRSARVRGGLAFAPDAISHLRLCALGWRSATDFRFRAGRGDCRSRPSPSGASADEGVLIQAGVRVSQVVHRRCCSSLLLSGSRIIAAPRNVQDRAPMPLLPEHVRRKSVGGARSLDLDASKGVDWLAKAEPEAHAAPTARRVAR
jgi:hypothetical protein